MFKTRRNFIILVSLGCLWLFLSPLAHELLGPIFYAWMDQGYYGIGILLSVFVGPRHCLFPYFSFALFGAVFGILLGEGAPIKKIRIYGLIMVKYGRKLNRIIMVTNRVLIT